MSLLLLHATKIFAPSADGWTHVGEQVTSPGLGGCMPCPLMSCIAVPGVVAFTTGAPSIPISLPLVTTKCRDTASSRVSISTAMSFIMHAEYCLVPCTLMREPCGIVHVVTLATSIISSVDTIDTD